MVATLSVLLEQADIIVVKVIVIEGVIRILVKILKTTLATYHSKVLLFVFAYSII